MDEDDVYPSWLEDVIDPLLKAGWNTDEIEDRILKHIPDLKEEYIKNALLDREAVVEIPDSGSFEITSVHREDIKAILGDEIGESFSDSDMEYLAGKMANDYCNQLFDSSLEIIAQNIIDNRDE